MRDTTPAGNGPLPGKLSVQHTGFQMGSDTEGKKLAEIEVTRQMIEAGMRAYTEFDDAFASVEEKFAAIYQAMWKARSEDSPVPPSRPMTLRTDFLAAGARWARVLVRR